jgi:hypothetical protein
MHDQRISVVPIDSVEGTHTVGLCFLSDLMYLLKMPEYHRCLGSPAIELLKEINCFDSGEDSEEEEARA